MCWSKLTLYRENKNLTTVCLMLQELIRSMLEVEVDQRYSALQVLEHPWVTVSAVLIELIEHPHIYSAAIFSHKH